MSGQLMIYGERYTYQFRLGETAIFSDFLCSNDRMGGRGIQHPQVSQVFLFIDDHAEPIVEARQGKRRVSDRNWRELVAQDKVDLFTVDQGSLRQTYKCEDWKQTQCTQHHDVWMLCGARVPRWQVTDYFAGNVGLAHLFLGTDNMIAVQDIMRYTLM